MKSFRITYALIVLCALLVAPRANYAADIDVCLSGCEYDKLWRAVDNAEDGDRIRIAAGNYSNSSFNINGDRSLHFLGGFNQDFSERDAARYESIIKGPDISSHSGTVSFEGITFEAENSTGIRVFDPGTDLVVQNCIFRNHAYEGIWARQFASLVVENSVFSNNARGAIEAGRYGAHGPLVIRNNVIDSQCEDCVGIELGFLTDDDIVAHNQVSNAEIGLHLAVADTSSPLILGNVSHSHARYGAYVGSGSARVFNNLFHSNGDSGLMYQSAYDPVFRNNIFAFNEWYGLYFNWEKRGHGPIIKHNIFYGHSQYALYFGNRGGLGISRIVPREVSYNAFWDCVRPMMHTGQTPYSFRYEHGYGELNTVEWSFGNFMEDPGFVDAQNFDFRLRNDSFLINEGDPSEDASVELDHNGNRTNIGLYGATEQAQPSVESLEPPTVSFLQSGRELLIDISTTADVQSYWLTLEYKKATGVYKLLDRTQLSGEQYTIGYRAGRIRSGFSRRITLSNADRNLEFYQGELTIRATIEHGDKSARGISPATAVSFDVPRALLAGRVQASSGEDLAGALVQVTAADKVYRTHSDANGNYAFHNLPALGQASILVSKAGYQKLQPLNIAFSSDRDDLIHQLTKRNYVLSARVLNIGSLTNRQGVQLVLQVENETPVTLQTDAHGQIRAEIPYGSRYIIRADSRECYFEHSELSGKLIGQVARSLICDPR